MLLVGYEKGVAVWIKGRRLCQGRKRPVRAPMAPLQLETVSQPLERVAMDIMGPLPVTERGSKYILVVGYYFTRWMKAYPMANQEAKTVAGALLFNFIARFGIPLSLHTDQGAILSRSCFRSYVTDWG